MMDIFKAAMGGIETTVCIGCGESVEVLWVPEEEQFVAADLVDGELLVHDCERDNPQGANDG